MNPKFYPIIYDSKTRCALNTKSIKQFSTLVKKISIVYSINSLDAETIFKFDSAIWAFGKQYLELINMVI